MKNVKKQGVFVAVTYIAMIVVNALANIIPINGNTTGDVSNSYPNLFAPAALTFSIWGVIYFLLAGYIFYQFGFFQKDKGKNNKELITKINPFFIKTSVANIFWIFSWHYHFIGLSLFFMLVILFYLIKIGNILRVKKFSQKESFFIRAPFSVYFGWITVATIANVTTFLVSSKWNGFGLSNQTWMIIILLVGAAIGILRTLKDRNIFYGLVLLWAYFGIWIKHTSTSYFNGQYPAIINTVLICLVVFLVTNILVLNKKDS